MPPSSAYAAPPASVPRPSSAPAQGRASSRRRRSTWSRHQLVVLVLTHAAAAVALAFPSVRAAAMAVVAYVLTGLGVSLGYHRGLAHGAFRASPAVRGVLVTLGALAFQGGPITWVGFHRAHHRFEDREGDPHAASRGFWWSHLLWALHKGPNGYRRQRLRHLTATLERDPWLRALERHHLALNLGAFALAAFTLGPAVALWMFPLRVVVLWHVTWLTNSLAHGAHGREPAARNVPWLALVGFGEGWHANHHEKPSRARFARAAHQVDPGFWVLALLGRLGLVRIPTGASPEEAS